MRVRKNTSSGDWQFGRSKYDYIKDDDAIAQNIKTRLQSFKNDWFLDTEANIDWLNLLGQRGTEEEIKSEVERVVLETEGVIQINDISLSVTERDANIAVTVTTIFNTEINVSLGVEQ